MAFLTISDRRLFGSFAARAKSFAEKLEFTADVEALGITKEQARAFGIGLHRADVYVAMRYEIGTVAGFPARRGREVDAAEEPIARSVTQGCPVSEASVIF
jgi:hypothetical protein